jgi:hypothetical protein
MTGNMGYVGPVAIRHLRRALPDARLIGLDSAYFALAMEWALRRDASSGPSWVVNVGSVTSNYQVWELAEAVLAQIPGVSININWDAPPDKRSYRVSFRKFETLAPQYQPRFTLAQTIRDSLQGFKLCGFQTNPDPYFQYSRLNCISCLVKENRLDGSLRWHHDIQ